jgi:hypothetical protein
MKEGKRDRGRAKEWKEIREGGREGGRSKLTKKDVTENKQSGWRTQLIYVNILRY